MLQIIKKRRNKNKICSAVKSNLSSVIVGQSMFDYTVLRGLISYASSSKNVVGEQNYLLVVIEKKNQTITQSLLILCGGGCYRV
jgi:hypothetical protein